MHRLRCSGIFFHISQISIGKINTHTVGHDVFCLVVINQGLSFCHEILNLLSGLVASYFLLQRPLVSIFFCLVVFQGLPPPHFSISPETTFINDRTGPLATSKPHVNNSMSGNAQNKALLLNSTSAYNTPSICGNPAEHT